jgi:hypothetical protein
MDTILEATPLHDFKISIRTSSGLAGMFNVKPYLKGSAFKELNDESYFRLVHPAHHGISWPHEQDFSSDTIIHDIRNAQRKASADRKKRVR